MSHREKARERGCQQGRGSRPFSANPEATMAGENGTDGFRPIGTAPRDGTIIQARIPGHGDDNMIMWVRDALESEHGTCGAWTFANEDQEPPDCWTDGWCWAVNENGVPSAWPTHWKPAGRQALKETPDA